MEQLEVALSVSLTVQLHDASITFGLLRDGQPCTGSGRHAGAGTSGLAPRCLVLTLSCAAAAARRLCAAGVAPCTVRRLVACCCISRRAPQPQRVRLRCGTKEHSTYWTCSIHLQHVGNSAGFQASHWSGLPASLVAGMRRLKLCKQQKSCPLQSATAAAMKGPDTQGDSWQPP